MNRWLWAWCAVALVLPNVAAAVPGFPAVSVSTEADGTQTYSLGLQVLALMTGLTLLPAALIMMTAFTRIIIVLAILRQALGSAQMPSSQVLVGLAVFLTIFVMAPVFERVYEAGVRPYLEEEVSFSEAIGEGIKPLREFMIAQTREADFSMFSELAGDAGKTPDEAKLSVVIPAFVTSELKTAFQFGFLLFIPFLIIDLVVASVLMSMGMMMLSPLIISFPFKIMLFVLVDGWVLIVSSLASSFFV
ncbi:MAG: flagellar type III secretion system pore protein FliP [Gammaproteobacteria bacterium]|nr:flagellar type III secretion system pore protein FliP [Gammaproteobacteria bacterium]